MKIFVSIASYCDELLFFTINSCIKNALNPNNIYFGIVDQNNSSQKDKIEKLDFKEQIRYVYINKLDSQGVCWARNIAFSLVSDEDYLLQIDSHMLFEKDWDKTLLEQYNKLEKKSEKPIISTYPYDFYLDENNEPVYKKPSGKTVLVLRPHPDTKLEEQSAVLRFRALHKFTNEEVLGAHLAAGFIFTKATFIEEVPYDPFLYFHGEEQSLAVRSYTKGWDIYHPTWIPIYHCYKKKDISYDTHHWNKEVDEKRVLNANYLKNRATKRLNQLLYGDGLKSSVYGLGNKRSLEEYTKFTGIDYKTKTLNEVDNTLK